jgi:signal transduction histidine kinase
MTVVVVGDDAGGRCPQYGAAMRWPAHVSAVRPRLATLRPPLADVLLAAGVLVVAQVETWMDTSFQPKLPLALLAVLITLPLAWRRQAPFGALLATGVAASMLGIGWPELNAAYIFIAVVVAVFSAGAYAEPRRAAVGCAVVLLWFWTGALIDNAQHPGQRGPSDAVFVTVVFGGAWLLGRALRGRGQHAEQLAQRAAQLEADQQAQARAAVAAERARIARELHDVIAHSVSVMVIQAGAAEQLLEQTPERARGPLEAVQDTGRQTIVELRRLLGILREDGQELSLAPQPGLAGLDCCWRRCARPACRSSSGSRVSQDGCRQGRIWPPTGSSRRRSPTPCATPARPRRRLSCATRTTPWNSKSSITDRDRSCAMARTGAVGMDWSGCASGLPCTAARWTPAHGQPRRGRPGRATPCGPGCPPMGA